MYPAERMKSFRSAHRFEKSEGGSPKGRQPQKRHAGYRSCCTFDWPGWAEPEKGVLNREVINRKSGGGGRGSQGNSARDTKKVCGMNQ